MRDVFFALGQLQRRFRLPPSFIETCEGFCAHHLRRAGVAAEARWACRAGPAVVCCAQGRADLLVQGRAMHAWHVLRPGRALRTMKVVHSCTTFSMIVI